MADSNTPLSNICPSKNKTAIILPTNATTTSTTEGNLQLQLPDALTKALIVPEFKKTLISIPQIVDAGYTEKFTNNGVYISNTRTNNIVWKGTRNKNTNLWDLPLQVQSHEANTIDISNAASTTNYTGKQKTPQAHINFLHQACGSPVKSTWLRAIDNNHYLTWPNLMQKNVK